MSDKKVISTIPTIDTKVETKNGDVVKTITTTTVEKREDGSSSTKTQIKTITEGLQNVHVDPQNGNANGDSNGNTNGDSNGNANGENGDIDTKGATKGPIISKAKEKEDAPRVKVSTEKAWLKEALDAHNSYRSKHGAPELKLSDDLCQVAQSWANKCAEEEKMQHSQNDYGENIYWSSGDIPSGETAVKNWYSEVKEYDYNNSDIQRGTGHFTQVVWKGSKELGMAKAKGVKKGGTYVVGVYNPAGNFIGQVKENVLKGSGS